MIPSVSDNTRVVLLLTAPLLIGDEADPVRRVTPGEYKKLVRLLVARQAQPADLLGGDDELLQACSRVVERVRLEALLGRGFKLAQALEQWQARGIWVLGRSDPGYPRVLIDRLREDAPPVLYGCGAPAVLGEGALGVVGSRNTSDEILEFSRQVGVDCAGHGFGLVSGGARGVDLAAMEGALEAGGKVVGVLAEGLEQAAVERSYREGLRDGRLVLVSATDPRSRFHVGPAMQRNKYIYGLSQAGLVVESDYGKGGTWDGAREQLEKLHFVPVFVRDGGKLSRGRAGLIERGAQRWPRPVGAEAWARLFETPVQPLSEGVLPFGESAASVREPAAAPVPRPRVDPAPVAGPPPAADSPPVAEATGAEPSVPARQTKGRAAVPPPATAAAPQAAAKLADPLLARFRQVLAELLAAQPMSAADIARALCLTSAQTEAWLARLLDEGCVEKMAGPGLYRWRP